MKKIVLYEEINSNLITRNSLTPVLNKIHKLKDKEIAIDFSKIEFISRSCADEYLKLKSALKKRVYELNINDNVKRMFEAVKNSKNVSYHYGKPQTMEVLTV